VITRNNGADIFCGLARNYHFKPINEIENSAIKTYLSRNKAISAFNSSWHEDYDDNYYKAVEVAESICTETRLKHE
jgi:hypothetical protein